MPNWCSNYVVFSGSAENLNKLNAELTSAIEENKKINGGFTLPCCKVNDEPTDGYIFDAFLNDYEEGSDLILSFESRWSPILDSLQAIAKHYTVAFEYEYEERGNLIFGKATFSLEQVFCDVELNSDEWDLCECLDEENYTLYAYNGTEYETETECLEDILKDKIKREANND